VDLNYVQWAFVELYLLVNIADQLVNSISTLVVENLLVYSISTFLVVDQTEYSICTLDEAEQLPYKHLYP
jgi:hypothetical protein